MDLNYCVPILLIRKVSFKRLLTTLIHRIVLFHISRIIEVGDFFIHVFELKWKLIF